MTLGRKTGGRAAGTPNKATAEVKVLAQQYGAEALETLANIMRTSENESAKVSAAKELLDRGYGKATQSSHVTGDLTLRDVLTRLGEPAHAE